ncbi:hypothetical protein FN846DRAFT_25149 [Sphaerosporella brunnea]|uniref:Ribose-5-phosphate isomerase n=1 Tax=Sphaerosporella brunnea TaxID=1250544 RepID=A0A5J5EVH8_9PEZI|nr:hypothetical protein FN846DRAFT_25149 [Sphaerosporella brunnea]
MIGSRRLIGHVRASARYPTYVIPLRQLRLTKSYKTPFMAPIPRTPLHQAIRCLSTATPSTSALEAAKHAASLRAVQTHYHPSMRYVGIGSGSTIAHVVSALSSLPSGAANTTFIPTGFQSRQLLLSAGLRVSAIDEVPPYAVDVAFDGADEVDPYRNCIKGGGACLLLEKLISPALGTTYTRGIPIEILSISLPYVLAGLKGLNLQPELRMGGSAKAGPCITDNGNFVVDAKFPAGYKGCAEDEAKRLDCSENVMQLAKVLNGIVGVVEHGLFSQVDKKPEVVYFGMQDGQVQVLGPNCPGK